LPLGVHMNPSAAVADQILRIAVNIVRSGDHAQFLVLDLLPVAIYVTDADGFISYFNPACIEFAGRQPAVGRDRWCVSWKLYTNEGQFLPHDQCPMARAIQTRQIVRGVTAIAERPNGSRVGFLPFPTPVIDASDELLGAVNILVVFADRLAPAARDLRRDLQTWPNVFVGETLASFTIKDLTDLIEEIEIELNRKGPRVLN
jgi:PAS domain-containing protein